MKGPKLLIILCFLIPAALAFSASEKDIFRSASDFYEKGDYKAAIKEYKRILDMGYESGNLYYNLGNSYFKDGRPGKAVLNYKRAENLMPRDGDLESNYKHVLSLLEHAPPAKPKILPLRLFDRLVLSFTVNELAIFLSFAFFLSIAMVLIHLYLNRIKRYFLAVLAGILILFTLGASLAASKLSRIGREAVIVSEGADSKFEPFERATTHFKLYEGATIFILDSKPPWCKVKRPDGKIGWVESSALERVNPEMKKAL
ncbi:MAG: tetratricopeptide repeat protein [Candidatus Omnitrophota bacterium]